ncbi:hypothetical protein [Roseisalinus antarcticus]|uniref:Uncharacterized protein n=1 Tax=Roseisalinus antarcticus TaxID=254357 RepID=A0A1Y5SCN6_9RHOB|nr:hypothetical protein [Roseisalinus antarcticus]SLN36178.1 hypothetical protein ROA7023_01312 [Roseisalinus antarcticus]
MEAFGQGLILPAICLAALGWTVPRVLARYFPEGVRPLLVLAFVAALVMTLISMGVFLGLYLWQGLSLGQMFSLGVLDGLAHFARLGAASALIWAPLLVLSVAGLPKHWVEATW